MSQILDALKGYITPDLVSKAASQFGESESSVSAGLGSMIPAVLGGLASKADDTNAMTEVFNFVKGNGNSSLLDNLGGLIGGDGNNDMSNKFMSMIFGANTSKISDVVSNFSGLKGTSASSLMGMVGPMVMGYLSKLIGNKELNASGFASLLGEQKESIMGALPAGLGSSLGFAGLNTNISDTASEVAEEARKAGSGVAKWLIPLLLLAAIAYGVYYFMGGSTEKLEETVADATESVEGTTRDIATATTEAVENAVEGLGEFFTKALPDGTELNIPEFGVENQLVAFIENDSKEVDKTTWFNFDRLTFETGKSTLDMGKSQEQLDNIVAIMKAYPETKIKIGGYTDNTGSEETNMQISQARAEAVMSALSQMGIASDRMEAEGYGACSSDCIQ